jgi:hypothetical protein
VWNTLKAKLVGDKQVLAFQWIDNNYVNFLTTIHKVNGRPNYVVCKRRRPSDKKKDKLSTNARKQSEGGEYVKLFPIPKAIYQYTHFMGGVDIHDQKRAHLTTHLRTRQNWLCLFFLAA